MSVATEMKAITKDTRVPLAVIGCCLLGLFSIYQIFVGPELGKIQTLEVGMAVLQEKNAELKEEINSLEERQDAYHDNIVKIINSLSNIEGQLKHLANKR